MTPIESNRAADAIHRALHKARVDNAGAALAVLSRVMFDVVMVYPPEQRETVVTGLVRMLTEATAAAAAHFPEEFGKPTK